MKAVRENIPLQRGTFPKNTEKDYSRPLFLTAYILPRISNRNSFIARKQFCGMEFGSFAWSTDQFCKKHGFRLYRFMQIGTHGFIIVVDIVAIPVHVAIVIYIGCVITIVTGRPEPPDAYNQIPG